MFALLGHLRAQPEGLGLTRYATYSEIRSNKQLNWIETNVNFSVIHLCCDKHRLLHNVFTSLRFLMIISSFLHDLEPGRSNITWGIRISRSQGPEMLKTTTFGGKTVEVFMENMFFGRFLVILAWFLRSEVISRSEISRRVRFSRSLGPEMLKSMSLEGKVGHKNI